MTNTGWKCPGCGACWAPHVEGCKLCDPRQCDKAPPATARDVQQEAMRAQLESARNVPCTCMQVPLPASGFCKAHKVGWGMAGG